MKTTHKIVIGDSRRMDRVADESVQLVVTSPPYWQLKDYGNAGQIGYNDTYEEYINSLNLVWKEVYRALDRGCRLCINIGDQFARSAYYGRYKVIPIRTEIIRFCETIGFDYMGAIIWQKVTTTNTTGGATIMGSFPFPRNGILKIDYEYILVFRKGGTSKKVEKERKERSRLTTEEWNRNFTGHWKFPGEKQDSHLAVFPVELPNRLIKMFSFTGDMVLDPFLGSGTTSLSAKGLQRSSVGYEINEEYLPLIGKKIGIDSPDLFGECDFIVEHQKKTRLDFEEEMHALPYVFKDPVRIERKSDPKSRRYGSKIDSTHPSGVTYYTVKEVVSPNTLRLNDGLSVRLIGIEVIESSRDRAVEYLEHLTKGKRVFLKSDTAHYDTDVLCCYLFLKNKTFINARLIKSGLVSVDTQSDYRHKSRFIKYVGGGRTGSL